MTIALTILIVVLCLIVAADLLLTRAVLRKLGAQAEQMTILSSLSRSALRPGDQVPAFHGTAEDGEAWSVARLSGRRTAIAFFSATCPACREHQPTFAELAADGFDQTLTVISGDRDAGADLIESALATGPVVLEDEDRGISRSFAVEAFPAFVTVDDHTIDRVSGSPEALRLHAPALR